MTARRDQGAEWSHKGLFPLELIQTLEAIKIPFISS